MFLLYYFPISFSTPFWDTLFFLRTLILETTYNDNYLLVLERPRLEIPYGETELDYQRPSLIAGHDRIVMNYHSGPQYYIIKKIYKLKGREQVTKIKEALQKDKK